MNAGNSEGYAEVCLESTSRTLQGLRGLDLLNRAFLQLGCLPRSKQDALPLLRAKEPKLATGYLPHPTTLLLTVWPKSHPPAVVDVLWRVALEEEAKGSLESPGNQLLSTDF